MTAQLSRERLEEIAALPLKTTSWGLEHAPGAYSTVRSHEIVEMARMLLAGMDSEPVAYISKADLDAGYPHILARRDFNKACPMAVYAAPPAPVAVPGHADCCPECGSKSLTWDVTVAKTSDVVQGRLRTSDVTGMFFLGCDECSETVSNVRMENIAVFLNACRAAMLKAGPVTAAALPDGWKLVPVEPTAEMCKAGYEAQDKWPSEQCDNFKERHYSFSQPRYKAMLAAAPAAPEQEV